MTMNRTDAATHTLDAAPTEPQLAMLPEAHARIREVVVNCQMDPSVTLTPSEAVICQ